MVLNHNVFTPQRWANLQEEKRIGMAKNLVERKLLDGNTKEDILKILGEPNREGEDEEGIESFLYNVGGSCPTTLCIEFDKNDNVKKCWMYCQ